MSLNNLYIHYHYQNYLRFGIESSQGKTYGSSSVYDFEAHRKRFIDKAKNKKGSLSEETIKRYETLFNQILTANPNNSQSNDPKILEAQRLLQQLLENKYQKGISNTYFTSTGKAVLSGDELLHREINKALEIRRKTLEGIRLKETSQRHKIQTLSNSLKETYDLAQKFIAEANRKGLNASNISMTVKTLDKAIKDIADSKNIDFSSIGEDGAKISLILRNYFNSN